MLFGLGLGGHKHARLQRWLIALIVNHPHLCCDASAYPVKISRSVVSTLQDY